MELKLSKSKLKKFLPYVLPVIILVAVLVASPFPFGAKSAAAAWSLIDFTQDVFLKAIGSISSFVLLVVSRLLWITGSIFDLTLNLTLKSSNILRMPAVDAGWKVCRDVVNIFFIFIILYIAIATILRLSGYGMKQLLVKVIILALLVNFSLMITRVIIDASNVLALEFYDAVSGAKITGNTQELKGGVTEVMMYALRLQTIYNADKMVDPSASGASISSGEEGNKGVTQQVLPTTSGVIFTSLMGTAFILVTAFVFLAATIMFVIRTVTLIFLMILSPLAFLGMALPATSGYASQWWDKLFKQAFFAPAFMFMLYLSLKIATGLTPTMFSSAGGGNVNASFSTAFTSNDPLGLGIILNFIILIGLMIGSILVAQSMGGKAASWGMTAAHWTRNKAQGYSRGYSSRLAKRGTGAASEGMLQWMQKNPENKFTRALHTIPFATRGLAKMSSWEEKRKKDKGKEYEKKYGGYSEAGLTEMGRRETYMGNLIQRGPRINQAKQKAINKLAVEKAIDAAKKEYPGGEEESINKKIESKQKEILALRRDKSSEGTKKMVEAVITLTQLKKELNKQFSTGEQRDFGKDIDELKDKQAQSPKSP